MTRRRSTRGILIAMALASLVPIAGGGCSSSSSLTNMWWDDTYRGPAVSTMLVIAMKHDPARRRIWEDGFADALAKHGVTAAKSYELFPRALPDTQQVVDAVRANGYQAVLVTYRTGSETSQQYFPGTSHQVPEQRYSHYWGTYVTHWRVVSEPGYVETERIVHYRTDVWIAQSGGRLVWTGGSETANPASSAELSREVSELVVPDLARTGIIPAKGR